jgi:gamma-glutamyltranspeptidase/glutathione hydrolase
MGDRHDRREALKRGGVALLGGLFGARLGAFAEEAFAVVKGCVTGQPEAAKVGTEVLAAGGNAVDAIVAAALTAGVVAVPSCGIGGYGGHMVIATPDGKKVAAIDFNSAAPAAAREDMFPLNEKGQVKDNVPLYGWLAAGVPGTLAGMQLALDRYGTQTFAKLVQPAIKFARDGFEIRAGFANATRASRAQLLKDPGSARLLLDKGEPLQAGGTFRNPELADLLQTLAERKSLESFYRGDIGERIAAAFKKYGGLVTAADMANYRAREVEPLSLSWRGYTIRTAPLTAGGLTILQALAALKALSWDRRPADDPRTTHALLEALRIAWDDRLKRLGDPEKAKVPAQRLLSEDYAREAAGRVEAAVKAGKPVPATTDGRTADGTIHLSAVDAKGMMVALTLTHGESFGARVTVDGLGLILGHGMSRFDPRPGHANSPGPGKRPLHNMCPTVVLRDGRPVLALGGRGGRKIPNAVFQVLAHYVGRDASLEAAVAAPRPHTEGDLNLLVEPKWPEAEVNYLKKIGYSVRNGASAVVDAVVFDPQAAEGRAASR